MYLNQSYYSEISLNTIENNKIGIGVDYNSDFNNITHNIINNNTDYGIIILQYLCEYNLIYNNTFIGNKVHAKNDGYNNDWDNGIIGNYWDDYSGKDPDDDGIANTPYSIITGIIGSQDNYPIWWDGPALYNVDPIDGGVFGEIAPNFQVRVDEGNGYYFWNEIRGTGINSSVIKLSGNLKLYISGTIDQYLWNRLSNGLITIRFYVNDSRGYIGYSDVEIIKNVEAEAEAEADDDDWRSQEGVPAWFQTIFTGIISAFACFIIIIFYNEYRRRKELFRKILENVEKVENIMAFLKEKLDNKDWSKIQELLEKYQKRRITSKDLIKEGRKIIGQRFVNLFTELRSEK